MFNWSNIFVLKSELILIGNDPVILLITMERLNGLSRDL